MAGKKPSKKATSKKAASKKAAGKTAAKKIASKKATVKNNPPRKSVAKKAAPKKTGASIEEILYRPVCIKEDMYLEDRCMSLDEAQNIARAHQRKFKHQVNWEAC